MKVVNGSGNLMYDDCNPNCRIELCRSQGELFAFVTALDIGVPNNRLSKPFQKRYWGRFNWENESGSIRHILEWGGKWPMLHRSNS